MHLRSRKGYVLVDLIYILILLSFFSTILMSIVLNNLKREDIKPYINRDRKSYNLEEEMNFLEAYLLSNANTLSELKTSDEEDKKISIKEDVFLEYDENSKLFLLRKDRDYIFLKENADGKDLVPYSYRY